MGTSRKDERALDALLRAARAEPTKEDLRRLERRLGPWLAGTAVAMPRVEGDSLPQDKSGSSIGLKSLIVLVGFGLFAQPFHGFSRGVDSKASNIPRVESSAPESAEPKLVAPEPEATLSVADLPSTPDPVLHRRAERQCQLRRMR